MHSPDYVCDEIGDLLVALSKCLNAPILIVVEIHGAIHVLTHAAISVPEVVPVHLDPLQELAVRPDLVRAAPLALAMMIVAVIHVEIPVVVTEIGPRVVNLAIVPVAIVVRAVTVLAAIVIGLLAVTDLTHVAIPVVAIVQPEIVVQGPIVVRVVNMVIVPFVVMIHVVILVVAIVIAPLVAMALVLDVRRAHVVMTVGTVVAAVGRVVKTSLHADQRTKPNVVVKPCAHVAVAKYAKTASKLRCHVKPRHGLMKAESKTKYAMPPKVPCAVRSHRVALCRHDQKMKTN